MLNIKFELAAADAGGQRGAFSHALFNSRLIERGEVLALLRQHNEKFNC